MVTTVGPDTDPNGYAVSIEGDEDSRTVQPNDTLDITGLEFGAHRVQLTDVASNCAVSGTNPKSVTILEQLGIRVPPPAVATFLVTCGVTTGTIAVGTTTTGDTPDPDGYRLLLDGVDQGGIGIQDGITLSGVTTSQAHEVALGGVDANCQLQGDNPQAVQVTPGEQAEVGFLITCQAPPPEVGAVQITATTTGQDPDPDGYALSLDGGSRQAIGINATVTISGLGVGDHQLQVSGAADNCQVQGGATRTVTVTGGATTDVSLAIACTARPGSIEVTTTTTGPVAGDYTVALDRGAAQTIGANGIHTFQGVAAGAVHIVVLGGFPAGCAPAGGAAQTVAVAGGQTARVRFTVSCSAPNTPPIAVDDPAYQVTVGNPLITDATNGVLVNDSDPDGDALQVLSPELVTAPASAADFQIFPNGGFRYTAVSGFIGSDQFTYQARDPDGATSNPATVTITVLPPNSPPVAQEDAYGAASDTPLVIDGASGVLSNDFDPEGDQLVAELLGGPTFGTLDNGLFPNGGFRYTPAAGFTGVDQFTYQARDSRGAASNVVTVTITVVGNSPPAASDDAYSMTAGGTLVTDRTSGVLVNDSDPDGDALQVLSPELVTAPGSAAEFRIFSNGGFRYRPVSGFIGSDQFTYQARDPDGATSNVATVTVTVNP